MRANACEPFYGIGVLVQHFRGTTSMTRLAARRPTRLPRVRIRSASWNRCTSAGAGVPVLFAYRHTLELYLKIIGDIKEFKHSLRYCVQRIEKRLGFKIHPTTRDWIIEFDKIDPKGTAFRYPDDQAGTLCYAEFWVDFVHLRFAMNQVF